MDSFELNKIVGAILFTCMVTVGLGILAEIVINQSNPVKPGYQLAEAAPAGAPAAPAEKEQPLGFYIAKASADKGAARFKTCLSCHALSKGGPAGPVGPNLWGVIGSTDAHMAGYAYSDAMTQRKGKGDKWDPQSFFEFIKDPQAYVPGTKMTFQGLPSPQDRANVLVYLNSQSDAPVDLPKS